MRTADNRPALRLTQIQEDLVSPAEDRAIWEKRDYRDLLPLHAEPCPTLCMQPIELVSKWTTKHHARVQGVKLQTTCV